MRSVVDASRPPPAQMWDQCVRVRDWGGKRWVTNRDIEMPFPRCLHAMVGICRFGESELEGRGRRGTDLMVKWADVRERRAERNRTTHFMMWQIV